MRGSDHNELTSARHNRGTDRVRRHRRACQPGRWISNGAVTTFNKIYECPDVSAKERESNELVKLIRKLRWIGMEEEAIELQHTLHRFASARFALVFPVETD